MTDFLAYWKPDQIEKALQLGSLPHAASSQFARVSVRDRVWICGRREGAPDLLVVGFIDVAAVLDQQAAQSEMIRRIPNYEVWDAAAHILAKRGFECATRPVSLRSLYSTLEFASKTSPRLQLSRGQPRGQQLQTMRQLTAAAAGLVRQLWEASFPSDARVPEPVEDAIDLDVLDSQRVTLARMEQSAARSLLLRGQSTAECAFCGRQMPASLLVAAHIKPRASCTDEEKRLIGVNVLALCKLGCDDLFERGYAEVLDGVVVAGAAMPLTPGVTEYVTRITGRRVLGWSMQREGFFRWRRVNRGWRAV